MCPLDCDVYVNTTRRQEAHKVHGFSAFCPYNDVLLPEDQILCCLIHHTLICAPLNLNPVDPISQLPSCTWILGRLSPPPSHVGFSAATRDQSEARVSVTAQRAASSKDARPRPLSTYCSVHDTHSFSTLAFQQHRRVRRG